jgi:type I restriction enzyme S subunit
MTWPMVQLKDCASIVGGATPKSHIEEYWNGDIPWVTPKDLSELDGKFLRDTPRKITDLGLRNCSSGLLPPNSVLFSSRAPIGHVAINTVPMATNQGFKSMVPGPSLDASFLYWWLKCHRPQLEQLGNGATFKEVSKAVVERIEIPLPPLEDQKRIAAILDQADELRRKRQHALDRLNQLGQAIFIEMFGDIRTAYQRFGGRTFDEIADVRLGKMLDKGKSKGGNMRPYLRNANVRWFSFDLSDISEMELSDAELDRFSLKNGDLLICEGGEPGRCAVWRDHSRAMYYQKALHRARLNTSLALPDFVAHWVHNAAKFGMLADSVTSATIAHLTGEKIKKLGIFLPAIDEQTEFVRRLKAVEDMIACHKSAEGLTELLFQTLQHRAFHGELTASSLKESAA